MSTKLFNRGVICLIVLTTLCVLLVSIQRENYIDEYGDRKVTLAPEQARTPTNLTGDNERQDIVKWARAQKDYREQSSRPITIFHSYYGKTNEPWCQMYLNWCSEKAKISATQFYRNSFSCTASFDAYKNLGGVNRTTRSADGIKAGWLVYERFGGGNNTPNHVGMYTGNSWMHGNYNDYYVREIKKNYGNLVGYAKPYYRSKVYFNTNKQGASMKGYVYPKEYSAWYMEEKQTSLSTKGLSCPGYTFDGWYTESSCTNKKVVVGTGEFGAIRVYAKWKASDGTGSSETDVNVVQNNKSENNIKPSTSNSNVVTPNNTNQNAIKPNVVKPNNSINSTEPSDEKTKNKYIAERKQQRYGIENAKRIASHVITQIKKEVLDYKDEASR